MCTTKNAPKLPALRNNPTVALTIDTEVHPPKILLIRGRADLDFVDGIPGEYLQATSTYEMTPEQRVEWEADVRSLYHDGMVRIVERQSFATACRERQRGSVPGSDTATMGRTAPRRNTMAKYLLLKHYRGAPAAVNDVPMEQWTPDEVSAHIQYMRDFAARLEETGEFVDGQALSPEGTFVRSDGEGRPPITDGPFAETKDLIAGWMVIDVETYERALELAGELSAAPGAGGKPIHEWLELRPFLAEPSTVTE